MTDASLTIAPLRDDEHQALDAFLAEQPTSSVFHRPGWHRVVNESFGHSTHYLCARREDRLVGVFPVTEVRHPLFGCKLVAMPYQMHSGMPLAESVEVRDALLESGLTIARERRAKYLEIRHFAPEPGLADLGFEEIESQLVTSAHGLEGLTKKKIRRSHRQEMAKAEKEGVVIEELRDLELLREFYRELHVEARAIGSPQQPWCFFTAALEHLDPYVRFLVARREDRFLGGAVVFDDGRIVFGRYGVYSSPEGQSVHLGKAIYWRIMSDGAERGRLEFNSGVTWAGATGLIRFKEGWNATTRPVHLYVAPLRGAAPSPGGYFEGFKAAKAAWRLMPLWFTKWAGRHVSRWVC